MNKLNNTILNKCKTQNMLIIRDLVKLCIENHIPFVVQDLNNPNNTQIHIQLNEDYVLYYHSWGITHAESTIKQVREFINE